MRNDRLFLADILDAVEAIERFTVGIDEPVSLPMSLSRARYCRSFLS